jgi:hypothetical protein
MPDRHFGVRPDLEQLRHQAKDLLRRIRRGEPAAVAALDKHHPDAIDPARAKLAAAQLVLARSYGVPSWPRIVHACKLIDAIWEDDVHAVRTLVTKHPNLIHENASGTEQSNWGPPMSYAANLGRDAIIELLRGLGATDFEHAVGRAALQGRIGTARRLHAMMGSPRPPASSLGGPAYTLSASGTALMLELGAPVLDDDGKSIAPVAVVLETDGRKPREKHEILEMYAARGVALPDTPVMAFHRGRIDLLEEHLRRDPSLLRRTFTHQEIFPPERGCRAEVETQGTPLAGTTLLHIAIDYDELEIARWLLDHGMDVDTPAAVDARGFGGHTALFGAVVSYAHFWMNYGGKPQVAPFAELLLDHGANPNARASLRKSLARDGDRTVHEYRDVTPLSWGRLFYDRLLVNEAAMQLIAERGGRDGRT